MCRPPSYMHPFPEPEQPQSLVTIDYEELEALCNIEGLQSRTNPHSTEEAHQKFIEQYPRIFVQPAPVLPRIPIEDPERTPSKYLKRSETPVHYHDIGLLLEMHHGTMSSGVPFRFGLKVSKLIKILRKLSFVRTEEEKDIITEMLILVPNVKAQISDSEMKVLRQFVTLESWERNTSVSAVDGLFVILKGQALPQMGPFAEDTDFSQIPVVTPSSVVLSVGSTFGFLETAPVKKVKSNILRVFTLTHCYFLFISSRHYLKEKQDIAKHVQFAKRDILSKSLNYQLLTEQTVEKLMPHLDWRQVPAGTVLVNEGAISPSVGFIISGTCHILKNTETLVQLPLKKVVKKIRTVLVGELNENESFGEISILQNLPFACTIVAATDLDLGVINADCIKGLDPLTQDLLCYYTKQTGDNIKQEVIDAAFIKEEKKREWKNYKNKVLMNALHAHGIIPETGKWKQVFKETDSTQLKGVAI